MLTASLLRWILTRSRRPFAFEACPLDWHPEVTGLEQIGLYVHIPFCRTLCSFCPYCRELYTQKKAAVYLPALLQEIDRTGQAVARQRDESSNPDIATKRRATSLYFGGGTPALMLDDLPVIIDRLRQYFEITEGIGIELHPQDITPENLKRLRMAGITMVSLGLQSFDPEALARIGRSEDRFAERLGWVREAGFAVIDVDLIFAIPGQTQDSLRRDIALAFDLGATQVSTYPFIDFTYADNRYKPMDKKAKRQLLDELAHFCQEIGLIRTSVWTFAKPGTGKYSSVTRDAFLGFGLSATSLLQHTFSINTFSLAGYIGRLEKDQSPTALKLNFSLRQRAAYFLFWGSYGLLINNQRFTAIIGQPLEKLYGVEMALAVTLGFLRRSGDDYLLTNRAIRFYHDLEQLYTTAYIDKTWSIARKEAFPRRFTLS
ncbi:MAG: radical SAM protein [Clostridia bacterium]|nr:radical SAM protein [Clostridia bacterium]NCC75563.1 radical SAM protein [Clostridia bacterium]